MTSKLDAALSHQQARQTYGFLAGALSLASRYEGLATRRLLAHAQFERACSVYEFGCGTGHFAFELLNGHLPAEARYVGVDVTPRMVAVSRRRLAKYSARAQIELSSGEPPTGPAGAYDRFVSNFVLDLLPEAEIAQVLQAAHAMLEDDGLLCLASLAPGQGALSRPVMRLWETIYRVSPRVVGGCRPLQLRSRLDEDHWQLVHNEIVEPLGIPLEVIVARKL